MAARSQPAPARPDGPLAGSLQLPARCLRMVKCTVQFTARHRGTTNCTVHFIVGDLILSIARCNSRPGIGGTSNARCNLPADASGGQMHGAIHRRRPPAVNCTVQLTTPTPKPANKTHSFEAPYAKTGPQFWRFRPAAGIIAASHPIGVPQPPAGPANERARAANSLRLQRRKS